MKKCAIALAIAALAATGFGVAAPSSAGMGLSWLSRLVTKPHNARPRVLRLATQATAETITFSERVQVVHRSFAIECGAGSPLGFTLSASPSSRITLTLIQRPRNGATCTILARADWVHDLGKPALAMESTFRRTFTIDSSAPPAPTTTTTTTTTTTAPTTTAPTTTTVPTTTTTTTTTTPTPPASATHFVLSAATTTTTAGQTDDLTITAEDAHGNTFTGYAGDKVLTFGGPASAPDGTHPTVTDSTGSPKNFGTATTITFVHGVASVSGSNNGAMELYDAGTASITVSDGSIDNAGLSVTTAPGTSAKLAFTTQPAASQTIQSTGTFEASASIEDTNGNLVDTDSSSVALAIGANPSSGVLSCTGGLSSAATNGVASFTGCAITKAGTAYTLTASDGGLAAPVNANAFDITAGPVASFVVEASGGGAIGTQAAGAPFNVELTAVDANGNTAAAFTGTVDVASNRTCSTGCGQTAAFTAGLLTAGVTLTQAGAGATITVTEHGAGAAGTSSAFAVNAGTLAQFTVTAPGGGNVGTQVAGMPFNVSVTALDAFSNVETGFSGTADLTSNRACSAGCTTTAAFTAGVLTSTSVTLTQSGAASTITATHTGGSATGTTQAFAMIAGAATHFSVASILTQTAGAPFNISITALDTFNNIATSFTGTVDLTSNRTCSAGCTTTSAFTAGVLASTSVTLTQSSASATITATQSGASATGTSSAFTVNAAAVDHFGIGPIAAQTAGAPFNVSITALDAFGNVATGFSGTVDLSSNRACSAGCTTTAAFTAGVLASTSVTLTQTGTLSTVTATRTGASETGTSNTFVVNAATVTHFLVEAVGGGTISTQTAGTPFNVSITAKDASNNTATGFTGTVDLTSNRTCSAGCATSAAFTAGVLTSTSVTLTQSGAGSTITATHTGGSETGTSHVFNVVAGATTHFSVASIAAQTAGAPFGVSITALDASDNTATNFAGTVDLTSNRTCSAGCTTTAAFTAGVLATTSVTLTQSGAGSTITATQSGASATGTSSAFTVNAATVDHFGIGSITAQTAGAPFTVSVTALDAFNNVATSFTGTVDVTSNRTCSAGCTTTAAFTAGVLASTSVTLTQTGTLSTITATQTGASETGTSNTFVVNAATVTHFLVEAVGGGTISTQTAGTPFNVSITAKDASNNTATGFTGTVNLTSNRTCTAGCTTTAAFTNGVLVSHSVNLSTPTGAGATITATRTGGSETGTSHAFTLVAGALDHFIVAAQGGGAIGTEMAGVPFAIQITAQDANGNTATSFTGTVDVSSNQTCTSGCTTSASFTAGVLALWNMTLQAGTGSTITATRTGGIEFGTSNTFAVSP